MGADWQTPALTDIYQDFLDLLKARDVDAATMFASGSETNIPMDAKRWNAANTRFERWDGAAWVALAAQFNIDVLSVGGYSASGLRSRANHTGTQSPSSISPQGNGSGLDADKLRGLIPGSAATNIVQLDSAGRIPGSARAAWRGARVTLASNINLLPYDQIYLPWGSEEIDTDDVFDAGAPTRLTVPAGVAKVAILASTRWQASTGSKARIELLYNGQLSKLPMTVLPIDIYDMTLQAGTGVIAVAPGDYFEVRASHSSSTATNHILGGTGLNPTFFQLEIVE